MPELINADKEFQNLQNAAPEFVKHGFEGVPFGDLIIESIQDGTLKLVDGKFEL